MVGIAPMQSVGAVGFQLCWLDIPDDIDPIIADFISKCWESDPRLRPMFAEIMVALKPLLKQITSSQLRKTPVSLGRVQEQGHPSRALEETASQIGQLGMQAGSQPVGMPLQRGISRNK